MKQRIITPVMLLLCLMTGFIYAQTPLELDSSTDGSISSNDFYYTYVVDLAEDADFLVVSLYSNSVDSEGKAIDLDLALKYGSEMNDYDSADLVNFYTSSNAFLALENPVAGSYYIDVVTNAKEGDSNYTIVASTLPQGAEDIVADTTESAIIGILAANAEAKGALIDTDISDESSGYHTYFIVVPEDTSNLKISMQGDRGTGSNNLDLYAKYGSEILDYSRETESGEFTDGDWDYSSNGSKNRATFNIRNPEAGIWFVDVANSSNYDDAPLNYTLTASTR